MQQNWKVKRQRVAVSSSGNEGFTIDLFDNTLHDPASVFRPSSLSMVRVDHDPAGMLAINLPPSSCRSLQFGFVGAHPCDGIESSKTKSHHSQQDYSRETEKEPVNDDECIRETHSLLREVHQAIFDEQVDLKSGSLFIFNLAIVLLYSVVLLLWFICFQVFDLVNREAFNQSLGANVTGIRENYLQLSIGQEYSVFISLVPSGQGDQTVNGAGTDDLENAILPLDTLDGVKLPDEKPDTFKKSGIPNSISYEIYLQQIFHDHVFVRATDKPVSSSTPHLSGQSAKEHSGLLGHFCMSLAHRIFSNKVLMELENVVCPNSLLYINFCLFNTWVTFSSIACYICRFLGFNIFS